MAAAVLGEAHRHVVDVDDIDGRGWFGLVGGWWLFEEEFHGDRPGLWVFGARRGAAERNPGAEFFFGVVDVAAQEERLVGDAGAAAQVGRPVWAGQGVGEAVDGLVGCGDGDDEHRVGQVVAAGDDGGTFVAALAGGGGAVLGKPPPRCGSR